jgi:nicotinamide-nucleotide amidase
VSSRAPDLVDALRARGLTIAVAESLTGGMLASELVAVPGASTVFLGGIVAYATRLKAELLGVDPELLAREGAIHPLVAEQLATGVRQATGADVGLSTTGAAGPDPQDGHAPGEVWIGVATARGVSSRRLELAGDRAAIRLRTVEEALALALGVARE